MIGLGRMAANIAPSAAERAPVRGIRHVAERGRRTGWRKCCRPPKGIQYVEAGTSGGAWGLVRGYRMMIGGEAETVKHLDPIFTPLRDPEHYQSDLNLPDILELWRRGSVVAPWLLDLSAAAMTQDAELSGFAGRVSDSGEGRWAIKAAIDEGVPVHVLSSALYEQFGSRGEADCAAKVLSAMRYEFGGHLEKPASGAA
jgi:6-phosphogluconate dehydrogenase